MFFSFHWNFIQKLKLLYRENVRLCWPVLMRKSTGEKKQNFN